MNAPCARAAAALRDGFAGGATSARVNSPPHTLQFQAMTLSDATFAAFGGFHFLDNSPPHSGQITLISFYRIVGHCGRAGLKPRRLDDGHVVDAGIEFGAAAGEGIALRIELAAIEACCRRLTLVLRQVHDPPSRSGRL